MSTSALLAANAPAPRRRLAACAALIGTALLAAGCGDGAAPPDDSPAALTIATVTDTLSELTERTMVPVATTRRGTPAVATGAVWSSTDTSVALVSPTGVVTGVQPGSATIAVRLGALTATHALRVLPVEARTLMVRLDGGLAADTLVVGSAAAVAVEVRDAFERALRGRRPTVALADSALPADAGRATLDSATRRLAGAAVGPVLLVARLDSLAVRARVIVRPTLAGRIALRTTNPRGLRPAAPDADTLWLGLADSAAVTFADAAGAPLAPSPFRPASLTTDAPTIASVAPGGRVTPLASGTTTLRAAGDRLTATRTLVVTRAPIGSIAAAPDSVVLAPGDSAPLRPILVDVVGGRLAGIPLSALRFEALTPGVATVSPTGLVRAVAPGDARVRITGERGVTTVPVAVRAPTAGPFAITVRFLGPDPAPEIQTAFANAARRWAGVIRQSIGSRTNNYPANVCSSGLPAGPLTITDVLIFARIDSIDGPSQILGSAGPCLISTTGGRVLPIMGRMTFDSADMRGMITSGRLENVIAHEMGHVLGIGTLWGSFGPIAAIAQQSGSDPRFTGPRTLAASAGLGFTRPSVLDGGALRFESVPLENTGGAGTAGSHWRRSVFGNELMNGFAGAGVSPLSLVTVQALLDQGYAVRPGAAEAWGTDLAVNAALAAGAHPSLSRYFDASAEPIREILLAPEWIESGPGRTVSRLRR